MAVVTERMLESSCAPVTRAVAETHRGKASCEVRPLVLRLAAGWDMLCRIRERLVSKGLSLSISYPEFTTPQHAQIRYSCIKLAHPLHRSRATSKKQRSIIKKDMFPILGESATSTRFTKYATGGPVLPPKPSCSHIQRPTREC